MTPIAGSLTGFTTGDVFQILRDGQPRTRSELAATTGFARATVAARVDALLATGLVAQVADAISTGGRPPARVAINNGARLVAGADFGATHVTVALADLAGDVQVETSAQRLIASGPVASLDWLADTVADLLDQVGRPSTDLIAIGVGLPGPVEHLTGRPTSPPIMPGWDGYDVPGHLSRRFNVPILVDNDVNVMALGEQAKGWPGVADLLFIKAATGIGSGIISNAVLHRGADGSAGDIGHIAVPSGAGIACRCGNTGCLEAIAGMPAVLRRLADQGVLVDGLEGLAERINAGDLTARETLIDVGRSIGEVVNMCISFINPSHIVVGGSMAQFSELIIAGIRQNVYARPMPLATKHLVIAQSRIGASAGVIGAASMALAHVLSADYISTSPTLRP